MSTSNEPETEPSPSAASTASARVDVPATREATPTDETPSAQRKRIMLGRLSIVGIVLATLAAWWVCTPSLIPRPWPIQAFLTGATLAVLYGLGATIGWAYRALRLPDVPAGVRAWIPRAFAVLLPIGLVIGGVLGRSAQSNQRELIGLDPSVSVLWIIAPLLGIPVGLLFLAIGRSVKALGLRLTDLFSRFLPGRTGPVLAILATIWITSLVLSGVLNRVVVGQMDRIFAGRNDATDTGVFNPKTPYASGGPNSTVPWDKLGRQGRQFAWQRQTAANIAKVTGDPDAKEPIRAYVGLEIDGDDIPKRAQDAVAELKKLGAFERSAIAVAGTTGSGWISPRTAAALEFVTHGDVATVALQYSYLPSWLSDLVDADRAKSASQEMITTLRVALNELPPNERPALYVYGESLGTNATDSAFTNVEDLSATTDGALLVGPPGFDPNFRRIQERRDPGSPPWKPVYKNGSIVQTVGTGSELRTDQWTTPNRVVYLVHATDPIVVWQGYDRKAWLSPRGPGVPGSVKHLPIVGGLQAGVDVFSANNVPSGYGHIYDDTVVDAWSEIHGPPSLPVDELDRIKEAVRPIDDPN
jgi:uncharacterized membrane protein